MVYYAILFYQDYRNHAKSNGKNRCFFDRIKELLSQTRLASLLIKNLYLYFTIFIVKLFKILNEKATLFCTKFIKCFC